MDQVTDVPKTDASGWYHCGRCGALFQATTPGTCPECLAPPAVEEAEIAFVEAENKRRAEAAPGTRPAAETTPRPANQPASASKGKARGLALFVIGWLGLMILVVSWVKLTRGDSGDISVADGPEVSALERQRQISEAYDACKELLGDFMADASPERRIRHVYRPSSTLPKMIRAANPAPVVSKETRLRAEFFERFELPGAEPAIQSRWITPGDEQLEIVFFRDEEETWKIDWENLVRWSEASWPLFLAGDEEATAEFRVLARRPASRTGGTAGADRVRLLEPRPWNPSQAGVQSPEIQVDPESEIGRVLQAAFQLHERGEGVFGTQLHKNDPKGMIRLRVRIRREPGDLSGRPQFHLEEILACHWMSIDALGVDPATVE